MVGLFEYANRVGAEPHTRIKTPVLVMDNPRSKVDDELLLGTRLGQSSEHALVGEPLVFELKKADSKMNAFAIGVTVGRAANNDVVVDDNSISRFHAYFQHDAKTDNWKLVDADSMNGTFVNGQKVTKAGVVLENGMKVRFGDIELTFMLEERFHQLVQQVTGSSRWS